MSIAAQRPAPSAAPLTTSAKSIGPTTSEARQKELALAAYNKQVEEESRLDAILEAGQARRDAYEKAVNQVRATNASIDERNAKRMTVRGWIWVGGVAALLLGGALWVVANVFMGGW